MIKNSTLMFMFILIQLEVSAVQVWNQKANMPGVARHRTTAFSIGTKGYIGLGHYNSGGENVYLGDFWEYDPGTDSWTQKADFAGGARYHATGHAYGNKAYVGTGRKITSIPPAMENYILETDWWEFDPIANTWIQKASMPGVGRRGAVSFIIDTLIFVGTGQINGGYTDDFYAYDINNDQWLAGVPPLPGGGRTSAVAFTIDNKGYAGTGGIGCGSTDFWQYKRTSNSWVQRADVGNIIRNEACAFAVNGKGYILTGDNCSSGTNYKDVLEYDPQTDSWTQLPEFTGAARRYMNAFVIGNKAYCGSGTSGVNYNDLWEYDQTLSVISRNDELLSVNNYPNPSTDFTKFHLSNLPEGIAFNDVELNIFNSNGQMVIAKKFNSSILSIYKRDVGIGTFFYTLNYEGQHIKKAKLIFI
jgi:N-acetylneuraminic acid mutarotase